MKTGICLIVVGMAFIAAETAYFGGNFIPTTWEEFVCDGIGFVMITCGYIVCGERK